MKRFKQFYEENSIEYHYTLVGVGGYHSENTIVIKSFGHVPDENVDGMVKYYTQLANEMIGEDEDFQGEYENYSEHGGVMADMYQDVGIDEAVGEYHIHEQYKIVKHVPPHRPIKDGGTNFGADETFVKNVLDGWHS